MDHHIKVLVVDDNPLDAELLVLALARAGFAPAAQYADDAASMRAALETQRPDIVFSDCNMGQFDALAALDILHEHASDIPLIVVTGSIDGSGTAPLLHHGASGVLLKDDLAEIGPMLRRTLPQLGNLP